MKWKKLGKIFDPTDFQLINNCREFAKSPQTLVFEKFVRIYFSTIEKDKNGKYLSHISFVDFDKSFKNIIHVSNNIVIELGKLGCFDEHGIFPVNVLRNNNQIFAYTTGWSRRVSVSVETSVGLAVSDDEGLTFKKIGDGPVLTSSLNEPFLVCDAFVKKIGEVFHMWYIFGTRWYSNEIDETPSRVYKIAHATSADGINWQKEGKQIIRDKLNSDECQALPTVIFHNNQYHMYFCYRESTDFRTNSKRGYRIGYAYSDDLVLWKRNDEIAGIDVSENGWDSDMLCYPHVFTCDGKCYMLYNGNEFGRFGFGLAELQE